MRREDIRPNMILRNVRTGEIGVPLTGHDYGVIDKEIEIAIVYKSDDETLSKAPPSIGTPYGDLEEYQLKEEDMLTENHMKSVCRPGEKKETCRYLTMSSNGFECAKVSGDRTAWYIDGRVRKNDMRATGNNCGGRYGNC